jgi:exodeoxyribonuclease VII large subunit
VFASKIPIVVAIGHERDVTLADLAADKRASTPTNAAEIVVPHRREIEFQIKQMQESIIETVLGEIEVKKQVTARLVDRVSTWLQRIQEKLAHQLKLLNMLSPQATLERGYSITFKGKQPLADVKSVKKGDIIKTKLAKGELESQVN